MSCYTLLSGSPLPWPPSCCHQRPTPFMGSEICVDFGALTQRSVRPAAPVLLTKNGPLGIKGSVAGFTPMSEGAPQATHLHKTPTLSLRDRHANAHRLSGKPAISPVYSLRISWDRFDPNASNHSLYWMRQPRARARRHARGRFVSDTSYHEGNLGGNQLLDGSISRSLLYPAQTIDLHVRIAADLHHNFPWLHPGRA